MNHKSFIFKRFNPPTIALDSDCPPASCAACRAWETKYSTLEQKYLALQDECDALRAEYSTRLIEGRTSSWQTNWKY